MSKTVKIPSNRDPWDCVINTKYYGPWPAGSTQTVPDEVAELIGNINAGEPVPVPPIPEGMWRADVPDGKYIASVNGGVAQYKTADPFVITVTATSASTGTSDKTAAEIIEAFEEGRKIVVIGSLASTEVRMFYPNLISRKENGDISMEVSATDPDLDTLMLIVFPWSSDDDNTWYLVTYTLTPAT